MKGTLLQLLVVVSVCSATTGAAHTLDRYGGALTIRGRASGWFHLEQLHGRWFFVTPDGNALFSLGLTHANDCIRRDELNLFSTKHDRTEQALSDFVVKKVAEWGFNSAGYGALEAMEKKLPYVAVIPTEGPRSLSAEDRSQNTDIFDPAVQQRLRDKVRRAAQRHTQNRFCLGYVFMDVPIWSLKPRSGLNYVEFMRALSENAPGRRAYEAFTQENPAASDEGFLNVIAEAYCACVVGELRAADPNHLILGDRFMAASEAQAHLRVPDSILKTASTYVDALAFQPMNREPINGYLRHVFEATGKPALLADVNTMASRPERDARDTTEYERGAAELTRRYYIETAGSPYCLGLHRCTIRDYQPWNPAFHRRGLLKADDAEYPILVETTRRVNRHVLDLVYRIPAMP